MDDASFVDVYEKELTSIAKAVIGGKKEKITGAAAALLVKYTTGSSILSGVAEEATAKAFGRWFGDSATTRLQKMAAEFNAKDKQKRKREEFAKCISNLMTMAIQEANASQDKSEDAIYKLLKGNIDPKLDEILNEIRDSIQPKLDEIHKLLTVLVSDYDPIILDHFYDERDKRIGLYLGLSLDDLKGYRQRSLKDLANPKFHLLPLYLRRHHADDEFLLSEHYNKIQEDDINRPLPKAKNLLRWFGIRGRALLASSEVRVRVIRHLYDCKKVDIHFVDPGILEDNTYYEHNVWSETNFLLNNGKPIVEVARRNNFTSNMVVDYVASRIHSSISALTIENLEDFIGTVAHYDLLSRRIHSLAEIKYLKCLAKAFPGRVRLFLTRFASCRGFDYGEKSESATVQVLWEHRTGLLSRNLVSTQRDYVNRILKERECILNTAELFTDSELEDVEARVRSLVRLQGQSFSDVDRYIVAIDEYFINRSAMTPEQLHLSLGGSLEERSFSSHFKSNVIDHLRSKAWDAVKRYVIEI